MNNFLKLTLTDAKLSLRGYGLWFSVGCAIFFSAILYWRGAIDVQLNDPFQIRFGEISYYILIVVAANVLSRDFSLKTSRIVFTGAFSRLEVISSKLAVFSCIAILLALIHGFISLLLWVLTGGEILFLEFLGGLVNTVIVYFLVACFVGSLALCVALLTFHRTLTIFTCLLSFIFFQIILQISVMFQVESLANIIYHSPFIIGHVYMTYGTLEPLTITMMLALSLVLFIISGFILSYKDLP